MAATSCKFLNDGGLLALDKLEFFASEIVMIFPFI